MRIRHWNTNAGYPEFFVDFESKEKIKDMVTQQLLKNRSGKPVNWDIIRDRSGDIRLPGPAFDMVSETFGISYEREQTTGTPTAGRKND